MVIAIDGPAGSGKSTVAEMLARKLPAMAGPAGRPEGFRYVNSGKLYRAITLGCLRAGIYPLDGERVLEFAKGAKIEYGAERLALNGEDVTDGLHTDEIDRWSAPLSAAVPVRRVVNGLVREIAAGANVVVEGRDMTSAVFPDAEHRFYLDASREARARRRFEQGVSGLTLDETMAAIARRDEIDRNKEEGSLILAEGVTHIDTSGLTINQVYAILESKIKKQGQNMAQMEVVSPSEDGADTSPVRNGENIQTQLQEKYLKSFEQLEEGQLVEGTVIQVTQDQVFVDVGYKSEGKIPLQEFTEIPVVGDTVSVILIMKENKRGEVIVSKQKADAKISWKNLRQAFQDNEMVEGVIEKLVKGGYDVNLGAGMRAFLPISQSDVQKVDKPEKFLGLKARFHVERLYSDGKVNIVVNRRKYLEEELERKRGEFFSNTPIGADVTGVVKSFTSFGAFIDLGGFDGLLHINDMSWGHVTRPKDFVKKGQEIRLKVIRIDPAEKRINLSLKHFTDDPWVHFETKFKVNDVVKGKVTKLTDFGAFIELEEGIEGLAHISEFSWVKKIQKPQDIVKPNDVVECMILGYDLQAGRVSLGLKQVTANPWDDIEERYPVGTRLTRRVVKITNAGAFVQLEEGIDGFLHGDDISWTKKVKYPGSELAVDQEIEVMVIGLDKGTRNIRVGIKQLSEDPWESFSETYRPGSQVEGEVSSVTDFGVFVRVPGGIEGLIHKSNLTENKDDNPDDALRKYKVGDKIKAVVIDIQGDRQKLAFSIRDYQKKVQKDELSRYMVGRESGGSTFTLGDFLKSKADSDEARDAENESGDETKAEEPKARAKKAKPAEEPVAEEGPAEAGESEGGQPDAPAAAE
ncbi:MAG: 30S ribosomal protein S1 [Treponema sp.]|nr:30S ribosomal protein S1 [Treponema sp.]